MKALLVAALLATTAPETAPAAPDAAWREAFLILASDAENERAVTYRPLRDGAIRLLAEASPASLAWIAGYFDPEAPGEAEAVREVAAAAGRRAGVALAREALRRVAAGETTAAAALLRALGATGDTSSWIVAADLLFHADPAVRTASARALGDLAPDAAAETLVLALGDRSADVRRLAADALGRALHPPAAALVRTLDDPDPWTAIAAAEALARLSAGRGLPRDAAAELERRLEPGQPRRTRMLAVRALGAGPGARAALRGVRDDSDPVVRWEVRRLVPPP